MKTLAIIPARYASTRFPGKPLALLGGRTIIERVWEAVGQTHGVDRVVVLWAAAVTASAARNRMVVNCVFI